MYSKYYDINTIILQLHYGIVPKMAAALPRWVATDTRCRRCWWERGSDVAAAMRLPSSWHNHVDNVMRKSLYVLSQGISLAM